jgi:hypothetical protein
MTCTHVPDEVGAWKRIALVHATPQVYSSFQVTDCTGAPVGAELRFKVTEDGEWDENENRYRTMSYYLSWILMLSKTQ